MEFFHDTKIDFLGKKWYFLSLTMVLFVTGMVSLIVHHGPKLGIDFKGGTQLDLSFQQHVPSARLRSALQAAHIGGFTIQPVGGVGVNEDLISLPVASLNKKQMDQDKDRVMAALYQSLAPSIANASINRDLNNIDAKVLTAWLVAQDPNGWAGQGSQQQQARYGALAAAIVQARQNGFLPAMSALNSVPGMTPAALQALQAHFFLGPFSLRSSNIIGPEVGRQLRGQALRAALYALLGMLIYIAFRFEWIYGVAAVVAVFHDVLITLGMFSLFRISIDLTVIAAFLTLIGYSMNDTIVVFDRVRENLGILRREKLSDVVNRSINQTLSRTVLTSGLTFLSVLSLLTLGGAVLRGFSFAMTFGILVGTYSSIAVAAPMMVAYIDWRNQRRGVRVPAKAAGRG